MSVYAGLGDAVADLTTKQKEFIVVRLACAMSGTEVREEFAAEFPGVAVTTQQISYYNPHTANGQRLDPRWKALFEETRKRYLEGLATSAIGSRLFRLHLLEQIAIDPETGKSRLGLAAIQAAAKEVGGLYERVKEEAPAVDPNALPSPLVEAVVKIYGKKDSDSGEGKEPGNGGS